MNTKLKSTFVKHDHNIKCNWLKWSHLFDAGLDLNAAAKLKADGFYLRSRLNFKNNNIFEVLVNDGFEPSFANEISNIDFGDINSINNFVETYNEIKSVKNNKKEWYTLRGWPEVEATKKLADFFKRGALITNELRSKSVNYDDYFKKTRIPGAIASSITNRVNSSSNMERLIREELLNRGHTNSAYYTPATFKKYTYKIKKRNFCHDMYIDETLIVEYNGRYWHKDYLNINKFTKADYMLEIEKAYNILNTFNRGKKYLILWEGDLNTVDEYCDFVDSVLADNSGELFFSTRSDDIVLYHDYVKAQNDEIAYINKYKKITLEASEQSKCLSKHVSAIMVKNDKIIMTGLNGTLPGFPNCNEYFLNVFFSEGYYKKYGSFDEWIKTEEFRNLHHAWSNENEQHAEMALIAACAKNGISPIDSDVFVSLEPCDYCRKLLAISGVKNVYFINEYDKLTHNNELLKKCGIYCQKI